MDYLPRPADEEGEQAPYGTRFNEMYRKVLAPKGIIHLKTDSPFLYTYTGMMVRHNGTDIIDDTADLYASRADDDPILNIRTHYEQQWLDRGLSIKYFSYRPGNDAPLAEPGADDIAPTHTGATRADTLSARSCSTTVFKSK